MNRMMVIVRKDVRETLRNKAFYISVGMVLLIVGILAVGMTQTIGTLNQQGVSRAEIIGTVQPVLGALVFLLTFLLMMLFSMYVNNYMVVIEKFKRTIESLMCTPASLRQVWIGKSLAVFLPSLVLGLVFSFAAVALIAFSVSSRVGYWILPGAAPLVASLIVVPLVVFLIACLTVMLQLIIANVRLINVLFVGIIFGIAFGLSSSLTFGPSSWGLVYLTLIVALVLLVVNFFVSKLLTKERVILSSKG